MEKIPYESVGNIKNYKHVPRVALPSGLIISPNLILKMYNMIEGNAMKQNPVNSSKGFLENEIKEGRITPLVGLGFAILSKDMLNVGIWDVDYPIVIKNQLYLYITNFEKDVKKLDIAEVGPFCIYELGIVNHERTAWKKYLTSPRTKEDKKRYLEDFIEGSL